MYEGNELLKWEVSISEIIASIYENNGHPWEAEIGDQQSDIRLSVTLLFDQTPAGKARNELQMLENNLEEDVGTLKEVKLFLQQLQRPFGFIDAEADKIKNNINAANDETETNVPDHKYYKQEQVALQRFDVISKKLATKAGQKEIPWALATQVSLFIYFLLTCFAMFHRADFVSLTVVGVGIYVIDNPQNVTPKTFRGLVLAIVCSWVYDLIYLLFLKNNAKEAELDGGTESTVRNFSFFCLWISFFFRIIVALIFWKDSHDFRNIMNQPLDLPTDKVQLALPKRK